MIKGITIYKSEDGKLKKAPFYNYWDAIIKYGDNGILYIFKFKII